MTTYLVVSDLDLLGPGDNKLLNLRWGEDTLVKVVPGLETATLAAAKMGLEHSNYGVTVFKVVEVAHYKPVKR